MKRKPIKFEIFPHKIKDENKYSEYWVGEMSMSQKRKDLIQDFYSRMTLTLGGNCKKREYCRFGISKYSKELSVGIYLNEKNVKVVVEYPSEWERRYVSKKEFKYTDNPQEVEKLFLKLVKRFINDEEITKKEFYRIHRYSCYEYLP